LAGTDVFAQVCDIVAADADRRLIVVSAPGKRETGDIKVTDLLIDCANKGLAGEDTAAAVQRVVERYADIQKGMGVTEDVVSGIAEDLKARAAADTSDAGRYMDTLKAAGEDNCAKLMAAALRGRGLEASYVDPKDAGMLLSAEHGNAHVLPEAYEKLAALRERKGIMVFPGFFGYTVDGEVVTFPRGGSDITGSILGAAVKAELYENFTDVDSVCAVDPRVVEDVQPIPELTYREMRELAYAGFGVLHDEAIIPAVHAGIPICIRNTNKPEAPGTRIVENRDHTAGEIVGIASGQMFCTIFVSKYLMNREVGFGRKFLQVFEEEALSYEHMPSGIDNLSIILREDGFDAEKEAHVLKRIREELKVDDVSVERGLALVMIVGEAMRFTVGIAARATRALADAGINIEMINQGSSEISLMFGVKADQSQEAVAALYNQFFGS
jgi:aspartate kinase